MKKTYYWTSNMMDTIHNLKICHGGKIVATVPGLNGRELHEEVNNLRANGYTHKYAPTNKD